MFQNVLGSDGRMYLERQFGNQRIDLTTGDVKTVIPVLAGMATLGLAKRAHSTRHL